MTSLRIFFFSISLLAALFFAVSLLRFGFDNAKIFLVLCIASCLVAISFKTYEHTTPQDAQAKRFRENLKGRYDSIPKA